jgi:hypothetical protein
MHQVLKRITTMDLISKMTAVIIHLTRLPAVSIMQAR